MSTHPVPARVAPQVDHDIRVMFAHRVPGTSPDPDVRFDGAKWNGDYTQVTFTPDLTVAEQDTLDNIVGAAKFGIDIDIYAARKTDLAGMRSYQNLASPTLAQTIAVTKAQSRVILAILRDD